MRRFTVATSLFVLSLAPAMTQAGDLGFTDTPRLPGGKWHVHDPARPHPAIVAPGKNASDAPSDAIVLFDGSDLNAFKMSNGKPADWILADGAMTVPKREGQHGDGSLTTKDSFGDIQLHIEFRSPAVVSGTSQNRGNSGVILMGQYEVQVLDSYENLTYADGQASAIYAWKPPLVNASRKPGEWQTYDIIFERPHFDASGKVTKPAYVTVLHNGILTQNHQAILGKTDWKTLATYHPHADALPFTLQDHGTPVSYRNIWVRKLAPSEE
ncbi:hypothetical protein MMA231_03532 (plasmid) [Asticcacaulis sp. MM231]|uniref:3-keto-disaccharide hydrolase n=1 Tax=Asticcacaulis sp. MM231 TaxID=3157666 RepID=UPI0032D59298